MPAAPQCISGRTSYLRVRLVFHLYPHLIREFCNTHQFGPSRPVTGAAAWTWVAHTVSGQMHATYRAIHARVRSASACNLLRRRHTSTRRVILQKARDHACTKKVPSALTAWTRVVSGSISLPSPGYFSPFPHGTVRYRSCRVACLGPWSAQLPTRFLVPGGTRDTSRNHMHLRYGAITRCGMPFQAFRVVSSVLLMCTHTHRLVSQPRWRNACMLGT